MSTTATLAGLLQIKSYAARAKQLHAFGAAQGKSLETSPEYLTLCASDNSFHAIAALQLAKGAGLSCAWAVDHPSALIRHTVVARDKMLTPQEAEGLLLSTDTSREMRGSLILSGLVPVNEKTLAAAAALDAEVRGKVNAEWTLLTRGPASESHLFGERVAAITARGKVKHLKLTAKTAELHTQGIIEVLRKCREQEHAPPFAWDEVWVKVLAVADPNAILDLLLVYMTQEQREQRQRQLPANAPPFRLEINAHTTKMWGGSAKAQPDPAIISDVIAWACRTNFPLILALLTSRSTLIVSREQILRALVKSPKATWREKCYAVFGTFIAFDQRDKSRKLLEYLAFLPACTDPKRENDHQQLLESFWSMVGQTNPEEPWRAFAVLYNTRSPKLPSAVVTADFLRHHTTVRSHPMKTASIDGGYDERWLARERKAYSDLIEFGGLNDEQRASVFEAFLGRQDEEGLCSGEAANAMFVALMKAATEPAPLQAAFNALLTAFGGQGVLAVLCRCVCKMGELEKRLESKPEGMGLKYSIDGLPTHWISLVEPPKEEDLEKLHPCSAFLMATLQSMASEGADAVLKPLCAQFGRQMFWRTFEQVLVKEKTKAIVETGLLELPPMPLASVMQRLTLVTKDSVAATTSNTNGGGGLGALSEDGEGASDPALVPTLYLKDAEETKKAASVKDWQQRKDKYLELIAAAKSETLKAKPAVYLDLMPSFLVKKLINEQDNVKLACVEALFASRRKWDDASAVFPCALWIEHIDDVAALWKACVNGRMPHETWKYHFEKLALEILDVVLAEWARGSEPKSMAALEFAAMAMHEVTALRNEAPVEQTRVFIRPLMAAYLKRRRELHASTTPGAVDAMEAESTTVLPNAAVEWAVNKALLDAPVGHDQRARGSGALGPALAPLPRLFTVLHEMGDAWEKDDVEDLREIGGLAFAWATFPCIAERWHALLTEGSLDPAAAEFILASVVEALTSYNLNEEARHFKRSAKEVAKGKPLPDTYAPWWLPVTSSAYEAAVAGCLSAMSSGDMRSHLGGAAIKVLAMRLKAIEGPPDVPMPSGFPGGYAQWDNHHHARGSGGCRARARTPLRGYITPDLRYHAFEGKLNETIAAATAVILRADRARARPLLIGALRAAEEAPEGNRRAYDSLVEAALRLVSPVHEGRLQVLFKRGGDESLRDIDPRNADRGSAAGSVSLGGGGSDEAWLASHRSSGGSLLAGLLDRYLEPAGALREERVQGLCSGRQDAPMLLFFGERFRRHLLRVRQDLLHTALAALLPFGGDRVEFYHYEAAEFSLARLASALRVEKQYGSDRVHRGMHMATWLLHPETQEIVLSEGLSHSTDDYVLRILPRLEFAQVSQRVATILQSVPKEQSIAAQHAPRVVAAVETPSSGRGPTGVVKGDKWFEEIDAKFASLCETSPPDATWFDAVQQRQADELILALGRADHAEMAMHVLSKFASESRVAREAISTTLPKLSRKRARDTLVSLIVAKETRLGARVSMLRMALELQLPDALGTCISAYRDGRCHRDVHATLLGRLACTPGLLRGGDASTIETKLRPMFASVAGREEDATYICETVLSEITNKPWEPDFLVKVIGSSWAFIPKVGHLAFTALCLATGPGVRAGDLASALSSLLSAGRMMGIESNGQLLRTSWSTEMHVTWRRVGLDSMHNWQEVFGQSVPFFDLGIDRMPREPHRKPTAVERARRADFTSCDPAPLKELIVEIMHWAQRELSLPVNSGGPGGWPQGAVKAQSFIDKALHVWILLLRPGNDEEQAATVDWMADQLKRVCSAGSPSGSWDPHHPSNVCVEAELLRRMAVAAVHRAMEVQPTQDPEAHSAHSHNGGRPCETGAGSEATCDGAAMRSIELALDAVNPAGAEGVSLLVDCWACLLSLRTTKSRRHDLSKLFKLAANVVDSATSGGIEHGRPLLADGTKKGDTKDLLQRIATTLFPGPHCWEALVWLSESSVCTQPPRTGLTTLAELAARAALEGSIERAIQLFETHRDSIECGRFVDMIAQSPHGAHLLPRALTWLSPLFPHKAASIYPQLLTRNPTHHMAPLLRLCAAHNLPLPPLTPEMIKGASSTLLESDLPEARVQAAHALAASVPINEKDPKATTAPADVTATMRRLLSDPCRAVAAVAHHSLLAWGEFSPKEAGFRGGAPAPKRALSEGSSVAQSPRLPPAVRHDSSGLAEGSEQEYGSMVDVGDFDHLSMREGDE